MLASHHAQAFIKLSPHNSNKPKNELKKATRNTLSTNAMDPVQVKPEEPRLCTRRTKAATPSYWTFLTQKLPTNHQEADSSSHGFEAFSYTRRALHGHSTLQIIVDNHKGHLSALPEHGFVVSAQQRGVDPSINKGERRWSSCCPCLTSSSRTKTSHHSDVYSIFLNDEVISDNRHERSLTSFELDMLLDGSERSVGSNHSLDRSPRRPRRRVFLEA
jgi:hypothetical protein